MVFVDNYASWCGPCKVMDRVFNEDQVGDYFNQHFINVKVDMEGSQGDDMLHDYGVVWLPTLLIIKGDGEVVSKIDRLVTGAELIEIARDAKSGYSSTPVTVLAQNPFAQKERGQVEADFNPEEKERILYVYDDRASSGRPHIMYHEAYLHLQLLDGKHMQVVRKYLSTQKDWTTEKNIKFIFDFLQDVISPEFGYFLSNRSRFEEVVGKEKVEQTISILVNQRLEKGFPRPSLDEAIELYGFINTGLAEQRGYLYYMNRLIEEEKFDDFVRIAPHYIDHINPYDDNVIHQYAVHAAERLGKEEMAYAVSKLEDVLLIRDDKHQHYFTLASLQKKLGRKADALNSIIRAIQLAEPGGDEIQDYEQFKAGLETG